MNGRLTHFSLCSGIGGLDIAAERAGFETVAQCEIDEYASRVLAKNFKGVPNLHDIRTVDFRSVRNLGIPAGDDLTVLSAGFPCQPYSLAGKGLGDRDGRDLWGEVRRVIGELRPKWFVGENTPGLFARENQRYFRRILDGLSEVGYSVGWGIWGACDVGAPHKRNRVFFIARSASAGEEEGREKSNEFIGRSREIPDTVIERRGPDAVQRGEPSESGRAEKEWRIQRRRLESFGVCCGVSDPDGYGLEERRCEKQTHEAARRGSADRRGAETNDSREWWKVEPDVGRVANGVSGRVDGYGIEFWKKEPEIPRVVKNCKSRADRLRCLGNAVVPAQAYPIFEAIAEYERNKI